MRKILLLLVVLAATIGLLFIPNKIVVVPDPATPAVIQQDNKIKTVEELINDAAFRHSIDREKFLATAKCESSLYSTIIGDNGNSIGLFQIHLPSHPNVLIENALDPEWAIEWAAKKFKIDPTIWVCYNKLYE